MYNTKDKYVRMKLSTYWKIRKFFPAHRGESASDYFERLAKFLEARGYPK